MAMVSSIIEELTNLLSSQEGNIECFTYHKTLFPAPATKREMSVSRKGRGRVITNVFHESIEESHDRTFSIPRMRCLGRTIPPYRGVVIRARCYGFSTDREVTTTFEHLSVTCHLPDNLSDSGQLSQHSRLTDVSTCSCRLQFVA